MFKTVLWVMVVEFQFGHTFEHLENGQPLEGAEPHWTNHIKGFWEPIPEPYQG